MSDSSSATEPSVDALCLIIESAGQTWRVPFDTLQAIPRVGEKIRLTGGNAATISEVEYEFAPEAAPVELAREMPAGAYARPVRIVVRLSGK
jgi:hypothetical protein